MAIETQISNMTYERLALTQPDRKWELWDGYPREKPGMTAAHNELAFQLGLMLGNQLDRSEYRVRIDAGRVHRSASTYFIPDVFVVPTEFMAPLLARDDVLEMYQQPLPLVVEVWSRSTGDYDVGEKLAAYQARGDHEIWLIHPYARTLTAWRRQPDGTYTEHVYREGLVHPATLPGVAIDLAALFAA
ncbi:MAG: Uma2 family endonuclease [Thermomicrobiales bacterium]